jgi:hypothetical protein
MNYLEMKTATASRRTATATKGHSGLNKETTARAPATADRILGADVMQTEYHYERCT